MPAERCHARRAAEHRRSRKSAGTRAFFSTMVSWHRYLAMTGESRATGRAITGAANLLFLFLVLSGMYLWWPRTWTWTQFRNVLWFRRGLSSKARDFNWHNAIGFWVALPLAVIVYSGVVISYPWAGNMVYRVMGEAPPAPAAPRPAAPASSAGTTAAPTPQSTLPASRDLLHTRLHDRPRRRRPAAAPRHVDAERRHRRREVGGFRHADRRPPRSIVAALSAHGRSGGTHRTDDRGARLRRRGRARLQRVRALVAAPQGLHRSPGRYRVTT